MNDSPTAAALIEAYVKLRDQKKTAKETFENWLDLHYNQRMDQIEAQLLSFLNNAGSDSIKSSFGTAYKQLQTSVTVSDPKEFQRHIIGEQAWDLLDWRANKTAVLDLLEHGQSLPPGVGYNAAFKVNIRRS